MNELEKGYAASLSIMLLAFLVLSPIFAYMHERQHADVYEGYGCNTTVAILPDGMFGPGGKTTATCPDTLTMNEFNSIRIAQAKIEEGGIIGVYMLVGLTIFGVAIITAIFFRETVRD